MICSKALSSRKKPAVSPMSGSPTFDIDRAGGVNSIIMFLIYKLLTNYDVNSIVIQFFLNCEN